MEVRDRLTALCGAPSFVTDTLTLFAARPEFDGYEPHVASWIRRATFLGGGSDRTRDYVTENNLHWYLISNCGVADFLGNANAR
jgi:hypothetical protein